MSSRKWKSENTVKLTYLALLTAMVVVLQYFGQFVRFGVFSCTLVLMPIVLGAAICGPWAGAWLGAVFAGVVFITGGANDFLVVNPIGTIIVVVLKGVLAGFCSGLVYSAVKNKNKILATVLSAVVAPVVNTGIFLIGCWVFFYETVSGWAAALGFANGTAYMFLGLAGGNFILELAINLILCPVIIRLLQMLNKKAFKI